MGQAPFFSFFLLVIVCSLSGFRGVVAPFYYNMAEEEKNSSHVDERGVLNLEGDGSVVGDVSGDDACGFSHLVTADVQLTHLSQAAR